MKDASNEFPAAVGSDLVIRARSDRDAFGQLCDLYYPRFYRHCRRRLFQADAAEDVVAEVFLSIARAMPSFPGRTHEDFLRWGLAIATNQSNAYLRKNVRRVRLLHDAVRRGEVGAACGACAAMNLTLLDWPIVHAALLGLPERDQSIVSLRFFEHLSHQEVADILEMQPGAVRTAECRALNKLRRVLRVDP